MRIIMGIQVEDRDSDAVKVQELLTKFGCSIKTRLGLHEAASNSCSSAGLILLEFLSGCEDDADKLEAEMLKLNNVTIRRMEF